ncbi:MAG: type IX secretion system membrane protein PorP/SprF [Bacteroidetes bacterium]|nr:MAG: type IX secretion system membrane protein PorP/SprF [Bacteroidota bacterium]
MKKNFTLLFFLFFIGALRAQQPAQYSLYAINPFSFNPAYAGMDNSLSLTGVYRTQWVGLPENPVTQTINAHTPLYFLSGGIGAQFERETMGNWERSQVMLAYNFQTPVGRTGLFSIGLSGGITQRTLDGTRIITPEGIYEPPVPFHNDPTLPEVKENGSAMAFNAGAFYQGASWSVGISVLNVTEQKIELPHAAFLPERTWFVYLDYELEVSKMLRVRPSVLLKTNLNQTQADFSVIVKYNDNIFAGASFRGYNSNNQDAVVLTGGLKLSEKIRIGYAYDLTLSALKTVSSGSHEILLNYNFGKPIGKGQPPKIIYNPRFL